GPTIGDVRDYRLVRAGLRPPVADSRGFHLPAIRVRLRLCGIRAVAHAYCRVPALTKFPAPHCPEYVHLVDLRPGLGTGAWPYPLYGDLPAVCHWWFAWLPAPHP